MTEKHYVLRGQTVVEGSLIEWSAMWKDPEKRRVARTQVAEANVSTVFLGIDHNFGGGRPIFFETMIFGGSHDQDCWRYHDWTAAEDGHQLIVEALTAGTDPWDSVASA
jgi:hypothetical protein